MGHFKHSNLATEKLKEFQKQMGLPELKVKQDVSTRWNSSLNMIERLIQIKNPLSAAMSSLRRAPNCLTKRMGYNNRLCPNFKTFRKFDDRIIWRKIPNFIFGNTTSERPSIYG